MSARLFALGLLLVSLGLAAPVSADGADPKMQLLFIGVSPDGDAPGGVPADLPVISIDALPDVDAAKQTVFAARLRSSPVSTFVSAPSETHAQFEQFFLITEVDLLSGNDGYRIGVGADQFGLNDFADRVSAVVEAFNPKHRRIGFLRVTDAADEFPLAISEVQTALDRIGFDMLVVMIGADTGAAACSGAPEQALHYSLVSGLADRAPFGDGNGVSTSAEVEAYLTRALNRLVERDPLCGPKYSLLIKSSNDPAQELVVFAGRSAFTEMETGLYNETFEAMFLLESDNRDGVHDFLANCLYCPNEKELTDRLRDMEEFARANSLEAEIWNRIKADTAPERLTIYLENCSLCTYRAEVEAKVAEIDAKARAFDAEARAYDAAASARDVAALRAYAGNCIACAYQADARGLVAEIEADSAYQAEKAGFAAAMDSRDAVQLQAYLDTCKICEGRDAVAEALLLEQKRAEFRAPCLSLAAVPQLGGPRKLEAIDRVKAGAVCQAAAQEFPEDGLIRTTLGRIAQAAGDFDTAGASYQYGMDNGVASAFGLAAYSHYAPPQGGQIDLDTAQKLARQGAEHGDWLSQEILTVLYSKDLVPGKTPRDAFQIAENIALEGNALAQFFVGYYYLTGTGVDLNENQAAEWLKKSVDQGYTHAYSFLAELLEKGAAGDPLPAKAADLYWSALLKGDPTATDRLTTQLGNRDREVIRIIQQKLRDLEVYRGSVDGIAGPGTVAAIRRYSDSLTEQG
ncbi:MAG: SEL1-like repeat protein [Rhodobacter sp.]|nr:SEL1-like repeat protein [Rhodobacter sp.]